MNKIHLATLFFPNSADIRARDTHRIKEAENASLCSTDKVLIFSGLSGSKTVGCKYNFPLFNTQALRLATKISSPLSGLFQRDIVE